MYKMIKRENEKRWKWIKFWSILHDLHFPRYLFYTLSLLCLIQYPCLTNYTLSKIHFLPFIIYSLWTLWPILRYPFSTVFWCILHDIHFPRLFFYTFYTLYLLRKYRQKMCFSVSNFRPIYIKFFET